jgi:hypothetical protein
MTALSIDEPGRIKSSNRLRTRSCVAFALAQILCMTSFAQTSTCGKVPPVPTIPSNAKTFVRPASSDPAQMAAAIQGTLNALTPGDWLIFPPGMYRIDRHLTIDKGGVTLYGQGATIRSENATDGALLVRADDVRIYSFTIDQASTGRQGAAWAGGISIFDDRGGGRRRVRGTVIQQNTINNSAGSGILAYKAADFTIAGNTIWRSWSDGIHMTQGAINGVVVRNDVSQTGDDMIAVVSYAARGKTGTAASMYTDWSGLQDQLNRQIYIGSNHVSDEYWGRGITVVGGSDVTIEKNIINKTPGAAGIYITRETQYMTFGADNILIRGNQLSRIQMDAPTYKPANINIVVSGHGAIELGATLFDDEISNATWRSAFSVSNVAIVDNTVNDAKFSAVRIGQGTNASTLSTNADGGTLERTTRTGPVNNIVVSGNTFSNVKGPSPVEIRPGPITAIGCSNNTVNGTAFKSNCSDALASAANVPIAVGANVQCNSDGSLRKGIVPKPPVLTTPVG